MKNPWEVRPDIWSTEAKFMAWLRGGIRLGLWNKHPLKIEHIKANRFKIANGFTKDGKPKAPVWGATCALCNETYKIKDIEVDHKEGGHSLKTIDDVMFFIKKIVFITDDDLQLVCKGCHKAKSYSEKEGISFEDALLEKRVIALCKNKAQFQHAWLLEHGVEPSKNATERRNQIRNVLKNENSL